MTYSSMAVASKDSPTAMVATNIECVCSSIPPRVDDATRTAGTGAPCKVTHEPTAKRRGFAHAEQLHDIAENKIDSLTSCQRPIIRLM